MTILPPDPHSMIKAAIKISPFTHAFLPAQQSRRKAAGKTEWVKMKLREHLGREFVPTTSGRHALDLVLSAIGLLPTDVITIYTSLGNSYVSRCVTEIIARHCLWSMHLEVETKVVLIIHEWGIPHPRTDEICRLGFPVIEDCAYAFASTDAGSVLGGRGQYAIFSLPKFFSVNFGGIACGLPSGKSVLPQQFQEYLYCAIARELSDLDNIIAKRTENWCFLKCLFASIGSKPFFELTEGTVPGVFMFTADGSLPLNEIKASFEEHDVECSIFYGTNGIFIPCNQNLTQGALEYLFAVYKGLVVESA